MIVYTCKSLYEGTYIQTENGSGRKINIIKRCEHNNIIVTLLSVMFGR